MPSMSSKASLPKRSHSRSLRNEAITNGFNVERLPSFAVPKGELVAKRILRHGDVASVQLGQGLDGAALHRIVEHGANHDGSDRRQQSSEAAAR